jgi:hypothetical protein
MKRIDAIEARANAATRPEWCWSPAKTCGPFPDEVRLSFGNFEREQTGYSLWCGIKPNDAEFIAHAREDVPYLVARLREAERLLERAMCDGISRACSDDDIAAEKEE